MAHGKYLYNVPYGITREIVMSMDADKSWESLAGEIGYSFDKIKHFELEYQKYCGSPTKALLWDWGSRNATVKDLYNKLKVLNRVREMQILENYVKETNHFTADKLMNKDESSHRSLPCISAIDTDDLPKPPPPRRQPSEDDSDSNEINFNHQPKSHVTKSKVSSKILPDASEKCKQYDDKKIPGTNSASKSSDSHVHQHHSNRVPQESVSTATSESSKASESTDSSSFDFSSFEKSDPMKGFETLKSFMKTDKLSFNDAVALMGTPFFEYKELFEATDGFNTSHKLGAGAFGTVFHGTLRCSKCAIKRLGENKDLMKNESTSQLRSELTALLRYRHENIVNLYGYAIDGPSLCLVYQYMVNGSLEDRLQCKDNTPPLSWNRRITIASGAAKGLQFLHNFASKALIHGDIKSANILLDKHFEAKIGDLGQAQYANSGSSLTGKFTHITKKDASSKIYGTRAYLAPEMMRSEANMSVKSDVFAFGVVLLEICSGEKPLDDKREGNKFLTHYFFELQDEVKEDEHKLCQLFRDKRAGDCPEQFIISLISCASNTLKDKKKDRIDMKKLLHDLEDIEDRWRNVHPSSPDIVSFGGSVHSNHLSHISGDNYSAPNLAQNTGKSDQFSGQPSFVSSGKQPSADPKRDGKCQQEPTSPVEFYKDKDFSSWPEALRLQMIADLKKEGRCPEFDQIALYKAMNKQAEGQGSWEEYQSDPEKMREMKKFNDDCDSNSSTLDSSTCPELQSDPTKLEALKEFDKEKRMVREPDESSDGQTGDYITDLEKLQKIEAFDRQNSTGSMPSGLLYGDQESQSPPPVTFHQQMQGVAPGLSLISHRQGTTQPCALNDGMRQLNVASAGHMYSPVVDGGMHQMRQNLGGISQNLISNVVSSPYNSGNFPDSPFSSGSHPTIIRRDLSSTGPVVQGVGSPQLCSPGGSGNFPDSPYSSGSHPTIIGRDLSSTGPVVQGVGSPQLCSPGGSMMCGLEVCEDLSPMAIQHNNRHGYKTFHSVTNQVTDTSTSQSITYVSATNKSHSLPEQRSTNTGQIHPPHASSYNEDRSVNYRSNTGQDTRQPVEYRQSEGFQYSGVSDQTGGDEVDEHLHGHGQTDNLSQGEGQCEEHESQRLGESSVDPAEFCGEGRDAKMKNFFDSYYQALANECDETEGEECDEGQEEGAEGEEGDDSVTDINV